MEEGQRQKLVAMGIPNSESLNPCCNGRGSKTLCDGGVRGRAECLNPCCNGRGSKTEGRAEAGGADEQ